MHAKSKISEMLPKSFKPGKCKTSLRLAASRIKLLKNKREALVKQMRRDLAQLLESGQEQNARIRVEHVIREEKTMSAYELIQLYCELIESRLPIIESQKNCPIDLKEAVSSVIFASPRCADIPELMDIRKHFTAKYGKEFVKAALEVRPDCGVSPMMVEKLSARAPDVQKKIKVLNEVAKEHDIKWDSKPFEEQVQKPKDDLLSGPSSFISAEKMTIKSSDVKPSSVNSWNNESTTKVSQNNIASQPKEVKSTYAKEESASMHPSKWKMEFKDATSAAEAAAESAERASMAARAAAELASRGNVSRQPSSGAYESSAYVSESEETQSVRSSYIESDYVVGGSVTVENDKRKSSHFVKPDMQNMQRDDLVQTSTLTEDESLNSNHTARENVMSEKSHFSGSSIRNVPEVDLRETNAKSYDNAQKSFSDLESAFKNLKNDNNETYDGRHDILSSSVYSSTFDDYTTKDDHENSTKGDSSDVVYDNYGSDTDDRSLLGKHSEGNLWESLPQPREEPSSFSLNMDSWSHKQCTSGSISDESSSQVHSLTEARPTNYSETIRKANLHSNSDDDLPPKYDSPKYDSEGPSSESEDEVEKPSPVASGRPSSFLHTDSSSRKGSLPSQPTHRTNLMDDTMEVDESSQSPPSAVFSGVSNFEVETSSKEKKWRSGFSVHNNQHTQRNGRSLDSDDTGRGPTEEEPSYTVTSDEGYETGVLSIGRLTGGFRNRGYTRPPYLRNTITDASPRSKINSDDSSLTNEKEISSSVSELSTSIEVTSEEKPSKDLHTNARKLNLRTSRANVDADLKKEISSSVSELSTSIEVTSEEKPSKDLHTNARKLNLRTSRANVDADLKNGEGQVRNYDVEGRESRFGGSLTSLNRSSDDTSTITGRPVSSHYNKTSEDMEDPVHDSYIQPRQRKECKESILRSSLTNPSVDIKEEQIYTAENRQQRDSVSSSTPKSQKSDVSPSAEKSTFYSPSKTPLSSEIPDHGLYNQKPHARAYNDSSSRMPINYSNLDSNKAEELEPQTTSVRGDNVVKLSRRTRAIPSVVKEDKVPRNIDRSVMDRVKESKSSLLHSAAESPSGTTKHTGRLDYRESSKPRQPHSLAEEPLAKHLQTESSTVKGSPKLSQDMSRQSSVTENEEIPKISSSSEKSTSRESSLKSGSHVHPKLPDYDSLAAHFQSLRANVRPK